jgi:hypothetical protein
MKLEGDNDDDSYDSFLKTKDTNIFGSERRQHHIGMWTLMFILYCIYAYATQYSLIFSYIQHSSKKIKISMYTLENFNSSKNNSGQNIWLYQESLEVNKNSSNYNNDNKSYLTFLSNVSDIR